MLIHVLNDEAKAFYPHYCFIKSAMDTFFFILQTVYDALLLGPGDGSVTKASLLGRNPLDPSSKYRHESNRMQVPALLDW